MFEGLTYQFVYNLERHRLFNIRLRRWLILSCLLLPSALWLGAWGADYIMAALATLCAVIVLFGVWWAGRQHYVHFVASVPSPSEFRGGQVGKTSPPTPSPATERGDWLPLLPLISEGEGSWGDEGGRPLPTMSKVPVRATGFFGVSGMRRYLVETPADYTTFETREHCVMTKVPLTRFLLVGTPNRAEVGWWYTFFQPGTLRSITDGHLHFGLRPRPALQLEIASTHDRAEILHLSFKDEATRSLVLADLLHDAVTAHPSPGR